MSEAAQRLTLVGERAGGYVVDEELADGRLVMRPETSAAAMNRMGAESVSPDDFSARLAEHGEHMLSADEARSVSQHPRPCASFRVRFDEHAYGEDRRHASPAAGGSRSTHAVTPDATVPMPPSCGLAIPRHATAFDCPTASRPTSPPRRPPAHQPRRSDETCGHIEHV